MFKLIERLSMMWWLMVAQREGLEVSISTLGVSYHECTVSGCNFFCLNLRYRTSKLGSRNLTIGRAMVPMSGITSAVIRGEGISFSQERNPFVPFGLLKSFNEVD